jgi:hypothetical protein
MATTIHQPKVTTDDSEASAFSEIGQTALPTPNWKIWRQSGSCRLWNAVALTMNVEPPKKSGGLKALLPVDTYREYRSRRIVAIRQLGHHPLLPDLEHRSAGKLPGEQYVALTDMLAFAQAMKWNDLEPFARGINESTDLVFASNASGVVINHADTDTDTDFDKLPKGERYTIVRIGAILTLLEQWLSKPGGQIPAAIRKGDRLNFTELAQQAHASIADQANAHDKTAFSAFGIEVLRKEFSESQKALGSYFS